MPPEPQRIESSLRVAHRAIALVAALFLVLAAACTSEPERRDLPDVDVDVDVDASTDAPTDTPSESPAANSTST